MPRVTLSIARSLAAMWIWLYTAGAPGIEREARRSELLSDLHDHVEAEQAEGRSPAVIAAHVVLRVLLGIRNDVAWLAPQLPQSLPERLENAGATLSRPETFKFLFPIVATLGMMNWMFFFDEGLTWAHRLLINAITLAVIVLMANRQRPWARRVMNAYLWLTMSATAAVTLWVAIEYRVWQMPILDQTPVQIEPAALLTGGVVIAVLAVAFIIMCLVFTILSIVVSYGALKSSAGGMRLMAAGIRHLT